MKSVGSQSNHDAMIEMFKADPAFALYFLTSSLKDCPEAELVITTERFVLAFDGKLSSGVNLSSIVKKYLGKVLEGSTAGQLTVENLINDLGINASIINDYRAMKIAA